MNRHHLFLFCAAMIVLAGSVFASQPVVEGNLTDEPLPRWMTPAEKALPGPHELDTITPPPDNPVVVRAEYEPKQGMILRWPFYYSDMFASMVDEIQDVATVYILVSSTSQQNSCINTLSSHGVGLENVEWLFTSTDAIWARDYGPWFVEDQGSNAIVDLIYYNTRPHDDQVPEWLAGEWTMNYYGPNIHHEGGNMMNDGHGTMMMSTHVFEANPSMTTEQVEQIYHDYFGEDTTCIFQRIALDGTGHIDLWAKIMNDHTILVARMSNGDVNYNLVESHAAAMDNIPTWDGGTFDIVRCPMPPVAYSGGYAYYRSYVNSILINHKALVPIYNLATDQEALDAYQTALGPDWTVVGIECNDIAPLGGAIHCVTMEVPNAIQPLATVDLIPVGDPIVIPFGGGSFQFHATLTNNTAAVFSGQAWTEALTPQGNTYGPILSYNITLQPNQVINTPDFSQYVPGGIPGGTYTYVAKVSDGQAVVSEDFFPIYKQGFGPDLENRDTDWTIDEPSAPGTDKLITRGNDAIPVPRQFALGEAYPNPFNPETTLRLTLPRESELRVTVCDVNGRQVATLANGRYRAGEHALTLDGRSLSSGIYFVRANVPGRLDQVRKVTLLK